MEKIKKALEKANRKRQSIIDESQGESSLNGEKKGHQAGAFPPIDYQQTQTTIVSKESFRKNRIIAALQEDSKADLFKILRTKTIQRMRANQWTILAVTSPTASVGKSFVASNLAVSIAMDANYTVLLADLDLRRPSIHKYFDLKPESGVRDYLEGAGNISNLLINPGIDSLVILPAGQALRRSSELLSNPKMATLVGELKNRYLDRIVIIDLPPLLVSDDAMVVMEYIDAFILVVAEGKNTEDEVRHSLEMSDETKYMGTILNKSEDDKTSEYY